MRLYLSSFRYGDHFPELLALLRDGKRVAVISNALDNIPAEARQRFIATVHNPIRDFEDAGLEAVNLDLRKFFGKPDAMRSALSRFDLTWVMGGNSFLLMRAYRQSGFDEAIRSLFDDDQIVYAGFSAGAAVAAPTLKGIEIMDAAEDVCEGYDPDIIWDGLGLIDQSIVPHYQSEHRETELADKTVAYLESEGLPCIPLRDGEVIIQDGDSSSRKVLPRKA